MYTVERMLMYLSGGTEHGLGDRGGLVMVAGKVCLLGAAPLRLADLVTRQGGACNRRDGICHRTGGSILRFKPTKYLLSTRNPFEHSLYLTGHNTYHL